MFEVYIWEVNLDLANSAGVDWTEFGSIGGSNIQIPGGFSDAAFDGGAPVSIGLPTLGGNGLTFNASGVLEFLSNYGAVKTISQPQVTVLSGSEATLRAANTENFVSSITRTIDNGEVAVSTETDSVDTGFTMTISSNWDNATIYGNVEIDLQQVIEIEDFVSGEGTDLSLIHI